MAAGRSALVGFLIGLRLAGWAAAWCGVGWLGLAGLRVMREQPGTLEGTLRAALGYATPLARGIVHESEAANPRHRIARNLVADGLLPKAEEMYRRLLAETPDQADYNLELGELLLEAGTPIPAERYLARAAAVASERAVAYSRLAEARIRMGQREAGLATRRRAAELGADLRRVDRELARRYLEEEDYQQAIQFFQAVDPEGRDPDVQFLIGKAWFESRPLRSRLFGIDSEATVKAREHTRRALALDPTHPDAVRLKEEL